MDTQPMLIAPGRHFELPTGEATELFYPPGYMPVEFTFAEPMSAELSLLPLQ